MHGITDDMVAGCRSILELSDELLALTAHAPILLAHGASFETRFLAAAGLSEMVSRGTLVDTLTLSRRRWPKQGNSLGIVATRLGIESPIAHRAGADAATCARVWLAIKGLDGSKAAPIDDRALERLRAKAGVAR